MRRIALFFVSTAAIIVLLFSYKTSRPVASAQASSLGSAAHIVSGATTPSSSAAGTSVPPLPAPTSARTPSAAATGVGAKQAPAKSAAPPRSGATTKPAAPRTPSAPAANQAPVVVDGSAVNTQYGPVQVELTITNKKITNVTVPQYPSGGGRDAEINGYALPQLIAEVLSAQSATIDAVSGATYTSQGFVTSLQSALDAANFGK